MHRGDRRTEQIQALDQLQAVLAQLHLLGISRDVVVQHGEVVGLVVDDRPVRAALLERAQAPVVAHPPRQGAEARQGVVRIADIEGRQAAAAGRPVAVVVRGHHQQAAGGEHPADVLERTPACLGSKHVEHVEARHDGVEAAVREPDRLAYIGDGEARLGVARPAVLDHGGVDVDAAQLLGHLVERSGQPPGAAAQLEHATGEVLAITLEDRRLDGAQLQPRVEVDVIGPGPELAVEGFLEPVVR